MNSLCVLRLLGVLFVLKFPLRVAAQVLALKALAKLVLVMLRMWRMRIWPLIVLSALLFMLRLWLQSS